MSSLRKMIGVSIEAGILKTAGRLKMTGISIGAGETKTVGRLNMV
jgi:hypothetical protein